MTLSDTIEQVQEETSALKIGSQNNSSFSKVILKLQLGIDSSSLDAFKKCPRFYELSIIEGWTLPFDNDHLRFGTLFHEATEYYAHFRAEGKDHDTALIEVVRHILFETWDTDRKRPWVSSEPNKTRKTLLRTVVWYLDQFQEDTLKTLIKYDGKPAVELSFSFDSGLRTAHQVPCPTCDGTGDEMELGTKHCVECEGTGLVGERYLLCGHIDRVVEWNGEVWITDKKTTKYDLDDYYWKQFTPNTQVSLYSIAGIITLNQEIDGLIIDGCQILVNGSRFRRRPIPRSHEQLEEWMRDLEFWLREMEAAAAANHWRMNETSCGYGRNQCTFRQVCSSDPSMRQTLLESHYTHRTWDPMEPR